MRGWWRVLSAALRPPPLTLASRAAASSEGLTICGGFVSAITALFTLFRMMSAWWMSGSCSIAVTLTSEARCLSKCRPPKLRGWQSMKTYYFRF